MNIFIVSHIADPDGITPVILSKLVFEKVDYLLLESSELEQKFINLIENNALNSYDIVYITDLGASENLYKIIDNNEELKNKIKLFDHHLGNMIANEYSFAKIVDINEDNIKESAASLYYKHLLSTYKSDVLRKDSIKNFVNLVREYDTWEWIKTNNIDAKRLANLFDIYGKNYFLDYYLKFLKENDTFFFNEKELFLLDTEQHRIKNYIEDKKDKIIPVKLNEYRAGLVFASQYRSELGNALATLYQDIYDFIIIISIERSVSYRSVKDIDLNEIAKIFNGKGHKSASGSPLPNNLYEKIIDIIFNKKVRVINE